MKEPFLIRLTGKKTGKYPCFGSTPEGECLLLLLPDGAECDLTGDTGICSLLASKEGSPVLRDDGGNVLSWFDGHGDSACMMRGRVNPGLFPLGPFLCGAAAVSEIMTPARAGALSRTGAELIIVWAGRESAPRELLLAAARTRAAENKIFVILAAPGGAPAVFGPRGEEILPVAARPHREWVLDRGALEFKAGQGGKTSVNPCATI